LPSSLTGVLPSASVSSTSRPVSVCGTVTAALARGFSRPDRQIRSAGPHPRLALASRRFGPGFPSATPPGLDGPSDRRTLGLASPHRSIGRRWGRNLDRLPLAYGFRPQLRTASPAADEHRCGTLRHSPAGRILTALPLLVPAFALGAAPARLPPHLPRRRRRSPTAARRLPQRATRGFGAGLRPASFSAHGRSTSELLRTLSRMAASKPTSWLSAHPHLLDHSARTWGP
jgi:hypothetical protein